MNIVFIDLYRDKQDRIFVVLPWTDLFYELSKLAYNTSGSVKGVSLVSDYILLLASSLKSARRLARAFSTITKVPIFYDLPLSVRRSISKRYN